MYQRTLAQLRDHIAHCNRCSRWMDSADLMRVEPTPMPELAQTEVVGVDFSDAPIARMYGRS